MPALTGPALRASRPSAPECRGGPERQVLIEGRICARAVQAASTPPLPAGLLDLRGIAAFLSVGASTVERLLRQGLPCLDLGKHHPERRQKRLLRFDPADVLAWLREHRRNGGGS